MEDLIFSYHAKKSSSQSVVEHIASNLSLHCVPITVSHEMHEGEELIAKCYLCQCSKWYPANYAKDVLYT